ncbi:MAG: hypothetical protein HY909_05155 [Deltaproteobacteria bacterium]|nr:hypothetical protein [Deltaproteobacteria bacterium]
MKISWRTISVLVLVPSAALYLGGCVVRGRGGVVVSQPSAVVVSQPSAVVVAQPTATVVAQPVVAQPMCGACMQGTGERCNGCDDNCNGVIDEGC